MPYRILLPLTVLVVLIAGLACENNIGPERPAADVTVNATSSHGAVTSGEDPGLEIVFRDEPNWDAWSVRSRGQSWTQESGGIKWIAFEPSANVAVSPEFTGVRQFRVTFDVYLTTRFPVYGTTDDAAGLLFGLSAFDPLAPASDGARSDLFVSLYEGTTWRIWSSGYDPDTDFSWDTGDTYALPWVFEHGWNSVEWTAIIEPGFDNDTMRLKVGDRIFSWSEINIAGLPDAFRFFRFGDWTVERGDRQFAIRNLTIADLDGDETPPPAPPPTPPPPPSEPPPSEPPPPAPPPEGDVSVGGHVIPDGFWAGWRARTHPAGEACEGSPCIRFFDREGYGAFRAASQAMRFIGDDTDGEGRVTYDIRFDEGQLNTGAGGKHLFNITSLPLAFTPTDIGLDNWTRIDFNQPNTGSIRATIFNRVGGTALEDGRWPSHRFAVPFEVGRWAPVEIRWRQENDRLTVTVNGASHTFELLPGSPNVGNYIAFGNIYNVDGEIAVANVSWEQ